MPRKRTAMSLTFAEAYHAAQTFLVHIGATPTSLDEPADGIVEFQGAGFISRLRYDNAALTQGSLLALLKTAEESGETPILFSASGFTGSAEVFGENLKVALFSITETGDMHPFSAAARQLAEGLPFDPPFADAEPDEDLDRPPGVWMPGEDSGVADHEWIDCETCGTTHHPDANFCHKCGASLARKNRLNPTSKGKSSAASRPAGAPREVRQRTAPATNGRHEHPDSMRCRNCGSDDIEVLATTTQD